MYKINGRMMVKVQNDFVHAHKTKASRGYAYEYIVVAAKKLGRDIRLTEIVHHRDGNHDNNDPENLLVLDSQRNHAILHWNDCDESILTALPDGSYTITQDTIESRHLLKEYRCSICGAPITQGAVNCKKCALELRKKFALPEDIEELKRLVWSKPVVKIAEELGVSDKAVAKRCKKLGVPIPPRGYWAKKEAETHVPHTNTKHGDEYRYRLGCRCEICVQAHRKRQRDSYNAHTPEQLAEINRKRREKRKAKSLH